MRYTDILGQFTLYLSVDRGLCKLSVEAYCQDISLFFKDSGVVQMENITQDSVYLFVHRRQECKEAEATVARRLIALKVFFQFLKEKGLMRHPLLIEHPKIWKKLPSILSPDEVNKLLAVPTKLGIPPCIAARDTAILHTLYSTGIRVSELCDLRIGDVNDEFVRVTGKGSKTRQIPLGRQAITAIDGYLSVRKDSPRENHLFLSSRGKKMDRSCVWRRIKLYASSVTHKSISPHSLRHAFATHLLDNQADLRIIQEMLGHARISSTEVYTHVAAESLIEKFTTYHPRNL